MKIYVAGKMTGLKNYRKIFDEAEEKLTAKGYIVMNPSVLKDGFGWQDYMHICLAMIDICDRVYMLKNWKDSHGAIKEHKYAEENRLEIVYEEEE